VGHLAPTGPLPILARQRDRITLVGLRSHASSYRTELRIAHNLSQQVISKPVVVPTVFQGVCGALRTD
jgi:hypothetical protein